MVEAVTFDWWYTIANPPPDGAEYQRRAREMRVGGMLGVLEEEGIPVTRERLFEAYDRFTDDIAAIWKRNVDLTGEEQLALILRHAGVRKTANRNLLSKLAEPFERVLFELLPTLNNGISDCLSQIEADGHKIGIISNTGRTWGRYLREIQKKLGIFQFFDVFSFSDEIGVRKPEPAIFRRTLEGLGVPPEAVVHIGDDSMADVGGAAAVGMKTVWYDNPVSPNERGRKADAETSEFSKLPAIIRGL